jgi:MoaA/NifB/PqqE/SkfB family radical SAM enzyme
MYNIDTIKDVHLELTSKCQARCPMCPRRINGGLINPLIELNEITLEQFKEWFTVDFIKQLDSLFMCGNLGDPIIAQDCLEILEYIKTVNPSIRTSMHTNGSARDIEWWKKLAATNTRVVFGIDGIGPAHSLYRIGTDWNKIINNARSFINAGGIAEWHMLVFEHNEHQIDTAKNLADEYGFKEFKTKYTSRFIKDVFNVLDDTGKTIHVLRPTAQSKELSIKVASAKLEDKPTISCKAKKYSQIYVAADGTISPCCWLDFKWQLPNNENRIDYMDAVGEFPNLKNRTMKYIFSTGYFQRIEDTWAVKPLKECSKQCGSFDKLGAQFAD